MVEDKPVLLAATGAARRGLVLDHALRPLLAYPRAEPLPTAVFAATDDWESTAGDVLQQRIYRAGRRLAGRAAGDRRVPPRGNADPRFDENAADLADFELLLKRWYVGVPRGCVGGGH